MSIPFVNKILVLLSNIFYDVFTDYIVTDLKHPSSYIKYVTQLGDFAKQINSQFSLVKDLKSDIRVIQKTIRQGLTKLGTVKRTRRNNTGGLSPTTAGEYKDTIVLEPEDLIFTIQNSRIPDLPPNLVYDIMNDYGETFTQYMYINRFAISFLKYICENFEVIIYSRIKISTLNQLMKQIKSMAPEIRFSAIIGGNSCANVRLCLDEDSTQNIDFAYL